MSLEDVKIRAALEPDLEDVISLLIDEDLNIEGVHENIGNFVVAMNGQTLVGCGGAEAFQFVALIRSIAVHPDHRSHGIGRRIVREMLDRLSSRGLREFYVVTEDAEGWFRKRGFKPCDRDEVHPQILESTEFAHSSDEATVMRLQMLT
jgi:amino-acid N-acetyltransferase